MTLTLTFDLLLKKLNLGNHFWTKRDRAFIFHMEFLVAGPFCRYQNFWLRDLDRDFWSTFEKKNLTLAIIFKPREIGLSYFTCEFLVARPFRWKQILLPRDLYLDFWPTFEILNFDHNFGTKSDRALILHISIPCDKTFLLIPIFFTKWPWPWLWPTFGKTWLPRGVLVPLGQTTI